MAREIKAKVAKAKVAKGKNKFDAEPTLTYESSKPSMTAEQMILEGLLTSEIPECPEGKSHEVIEDTKEGIYVCTTCALVVGKPIIYQGTEWRNFEDDGQKSSKGEPDRVGGPESTLREDHGLTTLIGQGGIGDSTLAKAHNKATHNATQTAQAPKFSVIQNMGSRMNLPRNIIERAQMIYKRVDECKEYKGRKTAALFAACLHTACKQMNVPRTVKEMCASHDVKQRELMRCLSKIKTLRLYKAKAGEVTQQSKAGKSKSSVESVPAATKPTQLLDRFCSLLKLPIAVNHLARQWIETLDKQDTVLVGKHPSTVAGAAIFQAACQCATPKTLSDVALVCDVKQATIQSLLTSVEKGGKAHL